jgi:hypothetical protein
MKQTMNPITLRSLAPLLLIAIVATTAAGLPREMNQNAYVANQTATTTQQPVKSKNNTKRGQHSIIFVGGKKGGHGAAKTARPAQAKKVNADLNPQPIPPGKQRHK